MVAIDYLELIGKGVDAWNRWRAEHPEACPDLKTAYLFERSLRGINLSHTNLSRTCLIGADLREADLTGAQLSGVYASNANFRGAVLVAADLRGGNLVEADFSQADLSDAVVDEANFGSACLAGARIEGWPSTALAGLDSGQRSAAQQPSIPNAPPNAPQLAADDFPKQAATQAKPFRTNVLQTALQPGSLKRLPVAMGVGTIAFFTAATAIYLTTRSGVATPGGTASPDQASEIEMVCNEPELTPVATADPDYKYRDGTRFYGQFIDGKPADGRGSMIYTSGNRYDGEYVDGRRNGCGTFTFTNGRRYVGEFKDDLFSGRGTWFLENGDRYVGDFEYNNCNGEGVFVFADGSSKSGVWQQGRLMDSDLSCDRGPTDLPES
ncbi:MAG: pentapeptide repeat-containing protein [Cyanobacteria bacterium P01_D01_bin.44]